MKTAISISDKAFNKAEKAAKKLGLSRSQLYARAIETYVDALLEEDLTKKFNAVYSEEEPSTVDPGLMKLQLNSLLKDEW